MKSIFMTSGPTFSVKKEDGERKAVKLNNPDLIACLKSEIEKYDNLVFVCSTPDEYEKNDKFAEIITKSLSLSGFKFAMSDLIDSRNWLFTKSLVSNADLIVLLGGDPLDQMEFFNSIELKEKLEGYNGCLLGISAGSINMGNKSYCSKDEDFEESVIYKGLGLVDVTIDPHFDVEDTARTNEILIPDSHKLNFISLPDDSFILVKDDEIKIYGDAYSFENGTCNKIEGLHIVNKKI